MDKDVDLEPWSQRHDEFWSWFYLKEENPVVYFIPTSKLYQRLFSRFLITDTKTNSGEHTKGLEQIFLLSIHEADYDNTGTFILQFREVLRGYE